jgi:signal transduction histidine kinase
MDLLAPESAQAARKHQLMAWSPRAWRLALCLAEGIPVQAVVPGLIVASILFSPIWLLPIWLPPSLLLVAGLFAVPLLTRLHQRRLRSIVRLEVLEHQYDRGLLAYLRARSTWRQACYNLVAGPLLAVAAAGAVAIWAAMAGLAIAPRLIAVVATTDARVAKALLGPSRAEELERRVRNLTQTRAGVVDAADAERRRLERDLHDGTQQRLVSLAVNLGMARAEATTAEEARAAIAEAHEAAKSALAELRDLVRGMHPAVLEDRGLDAALSGVAARMPIPVRLTVDLPRRPPPVIEAVAYFVVSEGLANVVKHANASHAEVFVRRYGERLHVIVSDDGAGGADPVRGSGLAGLARRAESVDGTFEIDSPPGGPTLLTVDLPCAR